MNEAIARFSKTAAEGFVRDGLNLLLGEGCPLDLTWKYCVLCGVRRGRGVLVEGGMVVGCS